MIPSSLPLPEQGGQGQGARAFTETLEVAIPLWGPGPVGRASVSRPAHLPCPLYTLYCV